MSLVSMKASFVISQGVTSGAESEADIAGVSRVLDMPGLNVLIQV